MLLGSGPAGMCLIGAWLLLIAAQVAKRVGTHVFLRSFRRRGAEGGTATTRSFLAFRVICDVPWLLAALAYVVIAVLSHAAFGAGGMILLLVCVPCAVVFDIIALVALRRMRQTDEGSETGGTT